MMILKMDEETIEDLKQTLRKSNFATTILNDTLYFFAKEKVRLPKGANPMEVFAYINEKDELVTEFAARHAQEQNSPFVTIGRTTNLKEIAMQGFILYTYFLTDNKSETNYSNEVIDTSSTHYWVINTME